MRHSVISLTPFDKLHDLNGLTSDANGDGPAIGDANPAEVDNWRSYQRDRLAHWRRTYPDDATQLAWRDLQTRWVWVHRDVHPLAANDHPRDEATGELLAMGLTPSAGDIQ